MEGRDTYCGLKWIKYVIYDALILTTFRIFKTYILYKSRVYLHLGFLM